jgi:hypothetical protein
VELDSRRITSLNGSFWTPKEAFEAQCNYRNDWKSMMASCSNEAARTFFQSKEHHVPSADCSCGMYAGINMQHLIDIGHIQRGIHGEVHLWGRLERNTLGWRAQFAYPKYFVVPANMIPLDMTEAKCRLDSLTEFDVDIYLQPDTEVTLKSEKIPVWMPDYGYTTQGLSWLVEKRAKWYAEKADPVLAVGDRVAVYGSTNGIGIVKDIVGDDMFYTMFAPDKIYRKPVKSIKWDRHNWRWETSGLGFMRKLEQAMGK